MSEPVAEERLRELMHGNSVFWGMGDKGVVAAERLQVKVLARLDGDEQVLAYADRELRPVQETDAFAYDPVGPSGETDAFAYEPGSHVDQTDAFAYSTGRIGEQTDAFSYAPALDNRHTDAFAYGGADLGWQTNVWVRAERETLPHVDALILTDRRLIRAFIEKTVVIRDAACEPGCPQAAIASRKDRIGTHLAFELPTALLRPGEGTTWYWPVPADTDPRAILENWGVDSE